MQETMIDMTPSIAEPALDHEQSALRLAASGEAALCTIVGIDGSFSRRVGAQLAVARDGTLAGSLSDGCLERELAAQSVAARSEGRPRLLRYGRGSPFIDFRLPCGSGLDILIDPTPDLHALGNAVASLDARRPAALVLPLDRPDLLMRRTYLPALRVLLLGAGPELAWAARIAEALGIEREMYAPSDGLTLGRPPQGLRADLWTAVVLLFHDHEWEATLLEWALDTPAFHIGAVGGATARDSRRALLLARGFGEAGIARVRSPVGLIPHARDARTLALSILSQIVGEYEALLAAEALLQRE